MRARQAALHRQSEKPGAAPGDREATVVATLVAGLCSVSPLPIVLSPLAPIDRNVGREITSWGKRLIFGWCPFVALPAMAGRDLAGILVIAARAIVAGGFVFAPGHDLEPVEVVRWPAGEPPDRGAFIPASL